MTTFYDKSTSQTVERESSPAAITTMSTDSTSVNSSASFQTTVASSTSPKMASVTNATVVSTSWTTLASSYSSVLSTVSTPLSADSSSSTSTATTTSEVTTTRTSTIPTSDSSTGHTSDTWRTSGSKTGHAILTTIGPSSDGIESTTQFPSVSGQHESTKQPISVSRTTTHSGAETATNVGGIATGCTPSSSQQNAVVGITAGVSAGIIVAVIVTSLICLLHMRRKWKQKLVAEREKTDLWTIATYNNTIVNDNFLDYRLAPSGPVTYNRESSEVSFAFDYDRQLADFSQTESGTLRRNTYSAPEGVNLPQTHAQRQKSSPSNFNYWINQSFDGQSRDRSCTFTAGKKFKSDKHVLLRHEEEIDETLFEKLGSIHDTPGQRTEDVVTEL